MHLLKQLAKKLKQEVSTVYLVSIDPRVPWYARLLAVIIVAYAFSPIDLIPDFIPILGYLDDLIIIPLGIGLILKLVPSHILSDCRERAKLQQFHNKPTNWVAAGIIVVTWVLLGVWLALVVKNFLT
ncbi:MAG: DUF1232 domain-containing protein [Scytonema sp. PMC 1069.18]|nr:DUF1232 domain-containing protein [Scytonema sp. PMC 1069.18]MEC4883320.1 DUF1232 domain-containing protein [Scytonema sp. PMC 1070.18]